MKICTKCHEELPLSKFHKSGSGERLRGDCKDCVWKMAKARQTANPEQTSFRRRNTIIKHKYGLTLEQVTEMWLNQNMKCAICETEIYLMGESIPHVDHDHACCPGVRSCGKCIRGLLCQHCNRGLGGFKDNPYSLYRAINYLKG